MNVRDDAPPWSFFIPVTLAVMVGVLAADGIRYAISTVFEGGSTPVQSEADRPRLSEVDPSTTASDAEESVADIQPGAAPDRTPAETVATARAVGAETGSTRETTSSTPATVPPGADGPGGEAASGDVRELPDSMTARRDGDPEACVSGTVVRRVAGGWEQALENDAPIPCLIVHR